MDSKCRSRRGTVNAGYCYEYLLPALLSLRFLNNEDIENFVIRSNVKNYGAFDDLVIFVTYMDKSSENYAIQLKHKNNEIFDLNTKSLSIFKYYEDFCNICKDHEEDYYGILFTNATLSKAFERVTETVTIISKNEVGKLNIFSPSESEKSLHKKIYGVKIMNSNTRQVDKKFLENFAVYTGQINCNEANKQITEELEQLFNCKNPGVADSYIKIFINLRQQKYSNAEIRKNDLKVQILHLFLSPHIIDPFTKSDEKFRKLDEAFAKFDFVVAEGLEEDDIRKVVSMEHFEDEDIIRQGKELKFLDRYETIGKLTEDRKNKLKQQLGYYQKGKPIIVKLSQVNVSAIVKLKQPNDGLHIIFCGNCDDVKDFEGFTTFRNLYDLKSVADAEFVAEITDEMKINVRGKQHSYRSLFSDNPEIAKETKINDMFQMIYGKVSLESKTENLSNSYIIRYFLPAHIKIEDLKKRDNTLILIDCKHEDFALFQNWKKEDFIPVDEYLKNNCDKSSNCIIFQNKPSFANFAQICKQTGDKNVHYFSVYNKGFLEWKASKKDIDDYLDSGSTIEENCVNESKVYDKFQNKINVILAPAGMGKSELLKKIATTCPNDFFPVFVNLREHSSLFSTDHNCDEILASFLESKNDNFLISNVKKVFRKTRKIIFYFDGLDELQHETIDRALTCIHDLSELGFKIWLTSRTSLEKQIKRRLHCFPINIKAFSRDDQKKYMQNRLEGHPKSQEMIKEIFANFETILENRDILDIPLQLYMITDFLMETPNPFTKSQLVLTQLFDRFIDGRYEHYLKRKKNEYPTNVNSLVHDSKAYRVLNYKIAGLKSCLSDDDFRKLNVNLDESFIKKIQQNGDNLGIILNCTPNSIIFHHNVTASYFAALWFTENYATCKDWKLEDFLFKESYFFIRIMFDMILAEESPAHIAVLYKNINALKEHEDEIFTLDKGGRSTLHLACSHCSRSINFMNSEEKMTVKQIEIIKNREMKSREILEFLVGKNVDFTLTDGVFKWNIVKFAAKTSFFALDVILRESYIKCIDISGEINNLQIMQEVSLKLLLYFGVFQYTHFFKKLVTKVKLNDHNLVSFLEILTNLNNWKTVDILLENGVDVQTTLSYGRTMLHLACLMNHHELFNCLFLVCGNQIAINCQDEFGKTPLHLAARAGHIGIAKILLQEGADIHTGDKYQRNVLHEVINNGKDEMANFLIQNYNIDLERSEWHGWRALELAIIAKNETLVENLLHRNLNLEHTDSSGLKALHLAATKSTITIFEKILSKSKNIDDTTSDGRTSLHLVAELGDVEFFDYLLQHKADINAQDMNGKSVLHWAVISKKTEIVKRLLKNNVDVPKCDLLEKEMSSFPYD